MTKCVDRICGDNRQGGEGSASPKPEDSGKPGTDWTPLELGDWVAYSDGLYGGEVVISGKKPGLLQGVISGLLRRALIMIDH